MPRYRRKRSRSYKISRRHLSKYSNETYGGVFWINNTFNNGVYAKPEIIPATTILGTRKAKNFTIDIYCSYSTETEDGTVSASSTTLFWALVYVPEGTNAGNFSFVPVNSNDYLSFYEPNQNVIMSGIVDSSHVCRLKSKLARNLNSGDTITLIVYDPRAGSATHSYVLNVGYTINYALSFS